MHLSTPSRLLGTCALLAACSLSVKAQEVKTVFVIAMENHNWTQPANQFTGGIQQIYQNVNAPFINSLVDGTAWVDIDGRSQHISEQVAYANAYHNVLLQTKYLHRFTTHSSCRKMALLFLQERGPATGYEELA